MNLHPVPLLSLKVFQRMWEKPGIEADILAQPIVSSVILVEVKL